MVQLNPSQVYMGQCEETSKNGKWLQTVSRPDGYYQTRSGQLWRGVKCRIGKTAYAKAEIKFEDYQDFAEWCHSQPEFYMQGYHLDKDVLGDSMVYSRDNCCFIPVHLNVVLQGLGSFRRGEKVGASYFKRDSCWRAYSFVDGRQIHLGYHASEDAAHIEWRKHKALTIKDNLDSVPLHLRTKVEEIIVELEDYNERSRND